MIVCPKCASSFDDEETFFCGRCGTDMRGVTLARGHFEPKAGDGPSSVISMLSEVQPSRNGGSSNNGGPSTSWPTALATDPSLDPLLERVIDGRYRIIERIGQGGMGVVYRVEHVAMGKQAAMKVLHPTLSPGGDLGRRFKREAEAVSRLSHSNIVQVFDFGETRGLIYLVMELIKGEDLGSILRRDGRLPFAKAQPLFMQVCDALEEAHAAGIVHRDIKPENLLISRTRDGKTVVKVLDFGLAKLRGNAEDNEVTSRGSLIGTPYYMSPEQIRGESLDGRSDLYALGALMYRVLTGEPPFAGQTPIAVLTQHLNEPLVPPSVRRPELDLSTEIDALIGKAMAKSRDERFASAEALREALHQIFLDGTHSTLSMGTRRLSDRTPSIPPSEGVPSLKREEVDAYERRLQWRRRLGLSIVPLLFAAAGAVGYYRYASTREQAVDVEHEPNNSPAEANLIESGKAVRGHIGEKLSVDESDRDFYHFTYRGKPGMLKVEVSAIPQMELRLEVFDSAGTRLDEAASVGKGNGVGLPNTRLLPGDYYIAVREYWVSGRPASVDPVNWYSLTATWGALPPDVATEPNDDIANATVVPCGHKFASFVDDLAELDYFRVCPEAATGAADEAAANVHVEVGAAPGLDLRVVALPKNSSMGENGALPTGAKVFDQGGVGEGESFDVAADAVLLVTPKTPVGPAAAAAAKNANKAKYPVPYSVAARLLDGKNK